MTSAVCLAAVAGSARAQSAEAEGLFNDGDAMMKQGKLAEACEAFEASNRIEPRAGTLIRLGECREQNHQLASAWSAYKDALTRVKDAKKKAIATSKVAQLQGKLSYLTVMVPDDSRLDGLGLTRNGQAFDQALWNRAVPVNGGDYVIVGRAAGHDEWTATVRVPVEAGKVSVTVPRLKEAKVVPLPPPVLEPVPVREPIKPVVDGGADRGELSPWTTKRKIAVGAGGVALVGLAGGVVFGSQAKSKQDEAHKTCPMPSQPCAGADRADSLIKQGQRRALLANVSFGVAAGAAIVAGVLWFTGAPEQPSSGVALVPSVEPGAATLSVLGRF